MLALALTLVLSQHGPKIIEVGQPVPVRKQENVVRPRKTTQVVKEGEAPKAECKPGAAPAAATAGATPAAVPPVDSAAAAEAEAAREKRMQELKARAEFNDELWRKSADALGGVR